MSDVDVHGAIDAADALLAHLDDRGIEDPDTRVLAALFAARITDAEYGEDADHSLPDLRRTADRMVGQATRNIDARREQ